MYIEGPRIYSGPVPTTCGPCLAAANLACFNRNISVKIWNCMDLETIRGYMGTPSQVDPYIFDSVVESRHQFIDIPSAFNWITLVQTSPWLSYHDFGVVISSKITIHIHHKRLKSPFVVRKKMKEPTLNKNCRSFRTTKTSSQPTFSRTTTWGCWKYLWFADIQKQTQNNW